MRRNLARMQGDFARVICERAGFRCLQNIHRSGVDTFPAVL